MCGILAIVQFGSEGQISWELLRRMTDTMAHRGPDHAGYWTSPAGNVCLGHRRLAIIDLSPAGRQPMANEDSTVWITFNGEIYNFQELRQELEAKGHLFRTRTDTEAVIHAYEAWGVECLHRFNGMWAFALWDSNRQRLFVARDRFGIKPLVYYYDAKRFICASEIKGIIEDATVPREMDPEALHHYLSLMNVPAPLTIYKSIRKLRPGHSLLVEGGRVAEQQYWDLPLGDQIRDDDQHILKELDAKLHDAVRLRLISDVPLGTFLSGGVDSSVVSAIAAQHLSGEQLNTFSVRFPEMGNYDESPWARCTANHVGSNHREFDLQIDFIETLPGLVRLFDEPFAISSAMALYRMAQEISKHVKVVLTGDGGDEVFGGYPWRHSLLDERWDRMNWWPLRQLRTKERAGDGSFGRVRWRDESVSRRLWRMSKIVRLTDMAARENRYLQTLYCYNEAEKAELYTSEWAEAVGGVRTDDLLQEHLPCSTPNRLARWLYLDLKTTLADEMLAKVDKATMACGLEARVPLLDHQLIEYAIRLPTRLKVKGTEGKRILKKAGEAYVPSEVLYRKKHGFNVPLGPWLRGGLQTLVSDILSESSLRQGGHFRPEVVQEILRRHRDDPTTDLSNPIFAILCFELWRHESQNLHEGNK